MPPPNLLIFKAFFHARRPAGLCPRAFTLLGVASLTERDTHPSQRRLRIIHIQLDLPEEWHRGV